MSLFKVPIISATLTTIKDGLQKKEVTFRREVESNQNENTDDAGSTHHEINYSLNDHFWFNKRVSHGADANTCLLQFQYHRSQFALKTAFTFTLNRSAKMQCSFTTDVDIRISLRNGLDFQYKMSFSLRHSPNWQIISLLTLKHLHYTLLGPEKACLSISFSPPPTCFL